MARVLLVSALVRLRVRLMARVRLLLRVWILVRGGPLATV
jgi:hypothetical protein